MFTQIYFIILFNEFCVNLTSLIFIGNAIRKAKNVPLSKRQINSLLHEQILAEPWNGVCQCGPHLGRVSDHQGPDPKY